MNATTPTASNHRLLAVTWMALASLLAVALLATATAARADYAVDRFIGEGQLGSIPKGPALNEATGQIYVVDGGRVQRFDADGDFEVRWGRGVRTGGTAAEVCTAAQVPCQRGTDGSGEGMFDGSASVGISQATGHVYVLDGTSRVQEFSFDDNSTPADPSDDLPVFVRAWGWDVIPHGVPGNVPKNEKQTVTVNATGGTFVLTLVNNSALQEHTSGISFNASASEVQAALEALENVEPGDVIVTGAVGGPWTVEFTGSLADTDIPEMRGSPQGLTGGGQIVTITTSVNGASFEICTSGCQRGSSGGQTVAPSGGQVGQFSGPSLSGNGIAVSPVDGDVFVADPDGRRVQRFNSDGTLDADPEIGSSANFAAFRPTAIAIDSRGILYAADTNNAGEIDRYDTVGVHGSPGFLTSIPSPPLLVGTGEFTTSGLAVDRDSDGVGSDVDRLYVYRMPNAGTSVIQQLDSPGEVAPPAVDAGPHAAGVFGNRPSRGLAVNPALDRLYVTMLGDSGSSGAETETAAGSGIFVLDVDGTPATVVATTGVPVGVDAHSAELSGTVDAGDGRARYRFEYSRDGVDWTSLATDTVTGSGPQAVSQSVEGLDANTLYRTRLVASKVLGPDDLITDISPEATFVTDAIAPDAETRPVHAYTDTSAWIAGQVNPNGTPTEYRFEWGTSSSYDQQVPVPAASAGSGTSAKSLLEKLDGLQPNTTYHYRIVAESAEGVSEGKDQTFTTRPAFGGFADRAFEQVSPIDKKGRDMSISIQTRGRGNAVPVSSDGNAAMVYHEYALGDQAWGGSDSPTPFMSRRGTDGWTTTAIVPRPFGSSAVTQVLVVGAGGSDLSRMVLSSGTALTEEPVTNGGLYLRDDMAGELSDLTTSNANTSSSYAAGSDDLDHVVRGDGMEWVDGELRLVARQPGTNAPFGTVSLIGGGFEKTANALSRDGEHIFFTPSTVASGSPSSAQLTEVYRRDHGAETVHVSPSRRSPVDPLGPKPKLFESATPGQGSDDPAAVFFTSAEELTDDANTGPTRAGSELYRYEVNGDTLTAVSAETNDVDGARVEAVLGHSDDEDWVYYVARGRVVAGEGVAGEPNVYLWHDDGTADGETRLVATFAESAGCGGTPSADRDSCNYSGSQRLARVSPDGRTLVFNSTNGVTGYRNQGHAQVFVYEADADHGEGQLSCVSCRPDGSPAQAPSALPFDGAGLVENRPSWSLSRDGRRVFFMSEDRLLAEDVNGLIDVYVWEAGRLDLISTGTSSDGSFLVGMDELGDSAFFVTRDRLVGQDVDELRDVYVARVGGGIAAQNAPPPGEPCVGATCKAPTGAQPPVPGSGSAVFGGEGNHVAAFDVAAITAKQRRALARRGRVAIRVRVDRPGQLIVRAIRARRVVGSGSKTALQPGWTAVQLKLARTGRRTLARRGRLGLRIEVRFAGESQVASVSLRRAK